eukprot:RCo005809
MALSLRDFETMSFDRARQVAQAGVSRALFPDRISRSPAGFPHGALTPAVRSSYSSNFAASQPNRLREDPPYSSGNDYEELLALDENRVRRGLPATDRKRLLKLSRATARDTQTECTICQDKYRAGVEVTTLPCKHSYHSECIGKWFDENGNCPICRKEVGS